ncbi:MAG: HlyD family efflux transporter periplasmic adaptor subunit [Candidatus Latescibacteria bacterium]|nr:HlyD family efflux transporter periplasmic adaptor subunit [Candidatus Latescibacterota bacterium]
MDIPREPKGKKGRYLWIAAGVLAIVAITLFLQKLEPAAPTVDGAIVWTDTVKRGSMLRRVRGTGYLRPEDIVYISAETAGRVARVVAEPGLVTEPETVLLELNNPQVELDALEQQRQLTVAEGELVNLTNSLETVVLNQRVTVNRVRNQHRDAVRRLEAFNDVREEVSRLELERTQDEVEELRDRLEIEERTLRVLTEGIERQLAAKRSQIERLKELAEFHQRRLESMNVKAGTRGVVRELELEVGQWVSPGQVLGVIIQPGRLKAVVRIQETQAGDVVLGQEAEVDTRSAKVKGHVARIDPSASGGMVTVDIELDEMLPPSARPDQSVEGVITIERLDDVLFMGRPTVGQANSRVGMFMLVEEGRYAVRVTVHIGQTSVDRIEIVQGLQEGDEVILSDMSRWDAFDRVRIRR